MFAQLPTKKELRAKNRKLETGVQMKLIKFEPWCC